MTGKNTYLMILRNSQEALIGRHKETLLKEQDMILIEIKERDLTINTRKILSIWIRLGVTWRESLAPEKM